MSSLDFRNRDELNAHNRNLDDYYHQTYQAVYGMIKLVSRTILLQLEIRNDGPRPANSVHADFHFPDGFYLYDERKFSARVPLPPNPPTTTSERLAQGIGSLDSRFYTPLGPRTNSSPPKQTLSIRKTNSFNVTAEFDKIRQGESVKIDDLYAVFDDSIKSFQIEYRLVADNLHKLEVGKLAVVVNV